MIAFTQIFERLFTPPYPEDYFHTSTWKTTLMLIPGRLLSAQHLEDLSHPDPWKATHTPITGGLLSHQNMEDYSHPYLEDHSQPNA
jgi:hypothetical protein